MALFDLEEKGPVMKAQSDCPKLQHVDWKTTDSKVGFVCHQARGILVLRDKCIWKIQRLSFLVLCSWNVELQEPRVKSGIGEHVKGGHLQIQKPHAETEG